MPKVTCGRTGCKYNRNVDDEGNWGTCCVPIELDSNGTCQTYEEFTFMGMPIKVDSTLQPNTAKLVSGTTEGGIKMVKIKIPITITTRLLHTDTPSYVCPQLVGEKVVNSEVEVEASKEVVEAFKTMWIKNILQVTVTGEKEFSDGEEIA